MRIPLKYALLTLALVPVLQGCDHKTPPAQTQKLAPPIVDTPPPAPATVSTADLPPPVVVDTPPAAPPVTVAPPPAAPEKKPVRHPKKTQPPPAVTAPPTPAAPAQEAAAPAPAASPGVSAIGELSGSSSGDQRSETEETITSTEKGVNGITRSLSEAETKTAAQIHEFLKQAREALNGGDIDGAHTLANKAKVLLTELNHS